MAEPPLPTPLRFPTGHHGPITSPQGPGCCCRGPQPELSLHSQCLANSMGWGMGATCCLWLGEGSHAVLWGPNWTQGLTPIHTYHGTGRSPPGVRII